MATFRVTIDCDNAAFEEYPGKEIGRILCRIADIVDNQLPLDGLERWERDYNGNIVACWHYN